MNRLLPPLLWGLLVATPLLRAQETSPSPTHDPAKAPPEARSSQAPPDAAKEKIDAREIRDLPYVTGGHDRQKLDLYLPHTPGPHPLIVWIHGGAWTTGDKNVCPAKRFVPRGYAAASIGYRLSQHAKYPAQIEDVKSAIRWLRAHAAEYDIDPKRIGVWGASAGGHLAALLGTTGQIKDFDVGENLDQSSAVVCAADWYGPVDFLHWALSPDLGPRVEPYTAQLLGGMPAERQAEAKRAGAFYFVTPQAAPFLILHGDSDPRVPLQQSQLLFATLQKAGVESTFKIILGGKHGGEGFGVPQTHEIMDDFFDRHLHPVIPPEAARPSAEPGKKEG